MNLGIGDDMFVVTFNLHCKPENHHEISQTLKEIVEKMKNLEGCVNTIIYKDINDENIFFLLEKWQKQHHLDDHMKSNLFSALLGIRGLLTKEPEIMFMNEY